MASEKAASLTVAQRERVRAIRDEFKAASVCTQPADRPTAEAAISRLYALIGHKAPRFIWCASPAAAQLALRVLFQEAGPWLLGQGGRVYNNPLTELLADKNHSSILLGVEDSLRRSLMESPRSEAGYFRAWSSGWPAYLLEDVLTNAVHAVLREPLEDVLRGPLGAPVWDSLRDSLPEVAWPSPTGWAPSTRLPPIAFWRHAAGQHDGRVIRYEVPRRLGTVTYDSRDSEFLDSWCALVRSCGWWYPYEHVCVVAERPAIVAAIEDPRAEWGPFFLHCPDGPAMVFRDGWAVHAWNGTRVPATLIEQGWDVQTIFAERNVEVRRCAIEKLGWAELERRLPTVASAPDPGNPGQMLTLCDVPGVFKDHSEPVRLLLCSNGTREADGTRRRFGLMVPAHHTDPVAAAAETYGWSRREYASLARRA